MNRRKLNISSWYLLGLAAILTIAALVLSVGVTWARYRTDSKEDLLFQPRDPATVYLGTLSGETLVAGSPSIESRDGEQRMSFVVGNALTKDAVPADTMRVRLQVVASAGFWDGTGTPPATLQVQMPVIGVAATPTPVPTATPEAEEADQPAAAAEATATPEPAAEATATPVPDATATPQPTQAPIMTTRVLTAVATRILPGSTLYTARGDGWVITFQNEDGSEACFDLKGGTFSTVSMTLTIQKANLPADTKLDLQVIGEWAGN